MTDLKRMDVHEALDKVRSEKDRLEEEVRTKTDLYNNLRKSQHELVTKFQETKSQHEKQTKELNAKSEEMISKLEEKLRDVEDQLKWKNEQFQHLEEAHGRLQYGFQSSKTEWEKEKALLLEEINSIQRSLDSQIRMSETLQTQLKICNQALAHEESTRKLLEVEVSEYKSRFDDIFMECSEAKATIEKLSHKRDEEVAELRDSLATKDSLYKEMGYKMAHLEQENRDLTTSLKELQESQIVKCGNTGSLKKLQKKCQDLEQLYKKCNENLKEKEVEWKSQMEKSKKEMDKYVSKLRFEEENVKQLQEELENFQIQNHKDGLFDDLSDKNVELEKENQSFLCKVNEQNEKIIDLQQEVVLLEKLVTERTKTIESRKQDEEKYFKVIQDKDSNKENIVIGFEQEKKSLLQVIEEKNKKIEELIEKMTDAFKNSEENQIENDVMHHALEKMEIEVYDLCEKMKLKDESLFQASKHVEELQGLLEIKKLEEENEIDDMNKALHKMETEISDLCEKMKLKDESLLQASKHVEELQGLLEIKKLEKQIEIDDMNKALHKMEIEVSELCEKMKLKDESLLEASKHVKELEVLLEIKKVEIEKMKEQLQEELENVQIQKHKDCLFDDLSDKAVELEKENQSFLCKVNEQNEKIVDLQQEVVLLENLVTERTKTIEAQKQDKESKIENLLIGFEKDKKSLLEVIEEKNKKIEELIEKMTNAFKISEEKQIENDVMHHDLEKMKIEASDLHEKMKLKDGSLLQASKDVEELQGLLEIKKLEKEIEIDDMKKVLHKMETEVSDLCENMKLKDESLFQASKHVKELEVLLESKKLEIEKMKEQFGDDKRQLEVENQGLREDITKLLSDREDLIVQMETMSEKMGDFSKDDELLIGMLDNVLKKCTLAD